MGATNTMTATIRRPDVLRLMRERGLSVAEAKAVVTGEPYLVETPNGVRTVNPS